MRGYWLGFVVFCIWIGSAGCGDLTGELVINEIAAAGEPTDWFELYNGSEHDLDLSRYTFSDDITRRPHRGRFPEGTLIRSGGYVVIYMDQDYPGFQLASDEELGVWDPNGVLIDFISWESGDSPSGGSYGRVPNGSGPFQTLSEPTPGGRNER